MAEPRFAPRFSFLLSLGSCQASESEPGLAFQWDDGERLEVLVVGFLPKHDQLLS